MRTLRVTAWPSADRDGWKRATTHGRILDEPGVKADLRAVTRTKHERNYGYYLNALQHRGVDIHAESPAAYVTPERVAAFIASGKERLAPRTIWGYVGSLSVVMQAIAPQHDWAWLRKLVAQLHRRATPLKTIEDRLVSSHRLYEAGLMAMHQAFTRRLHRPRDPESWYRDGLMVALLAARPIRLKNLAMIELGRHLTKNGGVYWLRFSAEETKTHCSLEFPLPEDLTAAMDRYLKEIRPRLLGGQQSAYLWISYLGVPLHVQTVHERIKLTTKNYLGLAINPHNFRHAAATSIAERSPAEAGIIRSILGHNTLDSSISSYNKARGRDAARAMADMIAKLRGRARLRSARATAPPLAE